MNQLDTALLRKNVTSYIVVAILIILAISIAATIFIQKHQQKHHTAAYEKQLHKNIEYTLNHRILDYTNVLDRLIKTSDIPEMLAAKKRDDLYKFLKPKWDLMCHKDSHLRIMNFYLADKTSFLQMNKPEEFSEQPTTKEMLEEAYSSHKMVIGYEISMHTAIYKIIAPIFDKQNDFLGLLEIGIDPSFIIDEIHEVNGFNGLLFVEEKDSDLFKEPSNIIIDGYRLLSELKEEKAAIIYKLLKRVDTLKDNAKFSVSGKEYIMHLHELKNFKNNIKIKILFFYDVSNGNVPFYYLLLGSFIVIGLILAILIWLIYRRIVTYENDVTKIYNKQIKKLDESEHQLLESQRIAHVGSWKYDIEADLLTCSGEAHNIFEADTGGKGASYSQYLEIVHPQDRDMVESAYKNSLKSKTSEKIVYRLLMKDGRVKYAQELYETHYDAGGKALFSTGTIQDITEQKNLENKLLDSQCQFEAFMHYTPFQVAIKDNLNKIIYANDPMKAFFGAYDIIGKKTEDLFSEDKAVDINNFDRRALKEGVFEEIMELENYKKDKTILRVVGFSMMYHNMNQLGIIAVDITQNYRDRQKIKEQEELMLVQSRHAAMGEMISMIAHQWRQPITTVAMEANNILADIELEMLDNETLKVGAKNIIHQTQELSKTIDDFRNFFKQNRQKELVLVSDVFTDAYAIINMSMENNAISVENIFDSKSSIFTYSRELLQVIINLLKNAKEALVENRADERKITNSIYETANSIKIEICDNGGGIDEKIIYKIFDPYFTTKDQKNGTGLGLYISKTIVEKHLYGTISVKNTKNTKGERVGTCFIIELPKTEERKEIDG